MIWKKYNTTVCKYEPAELHVTSTASPRQPHGSRKGGGETNISILKSTEPTWPTQRSNLKIFKGVSLLYVLDVTFFLWEERLWLQRLAASYRGKFQVHTASEEEKKKKRKERTEQEQSYAVISMVCPAVSAGLVQLAPSGSVLVVPRLRTPSVEPTLEAEWVLERTSRVIPAVGTEGGRERHECVITEHISLELVRVCVTAGHSLSDQHVLIWIVHTVTEDVCTYTHIFENWYLVT